VECLLLLTTSHYCIHLLQVSAMDLGVAVKQEVATCNDFTSNVNSLSTDSGSSCTAFTAPVTVALNSVLTAKAAVEASGASSTGILPTYVTAATKVGDTSSPFKLVIATSSLPPVAPRTSAKVQSTVGGLGQPTLLLGPAVAAPGGMTSPRKTVTVLPAGIRSPTQGPVAVINARPPLAPAALSSVWSPTKVTVLSLPKTSGQFVTVVSSSGAATAVSTTNNRTAVMPYKVFVRPPSKVSFLLSYVTVVSVHLFTLGDEKIGHLLSRVICFLLLLPE